MTNVDIKHVIKKTFALCQEKIVHNTLIIETKTKLVSNKEFLNAKLPINKFLNVEKMNMWEILKLPKTPGTYVIEGIDKLNDVYAKAVYGWALAGKPNGVRAVLTTETIPSYISNDVEKIYF